MRLTDAERAMLAGESGPAVAMAMELVVAAGDAMDAERLIHISGAHIDGCLFHGRASLDFAQRLAEAAGRVAVPTTLNVSSLDLLHPDLYRGDPATAEQARLLMEAYEAMGCRPTWTCAPYQLAQRPSFGDHVAWGESNAIVFANSVLGARTNRYGDFLDISCALTGRAPAVGLHLDEGRRATVRIDVDVGDGHLDSDLTYVALGHVLGQVADDEVAVVVGLDQRADEDRLKAMGASAASSGAVGMFHVAGVTPEAPTVERACGGSPPQRVEWIDARRLEAAVSQLSSGAAAGLGAVSIGTPHASLGEIETMASLMAGKRTAVPFYVNTGRDVLGQAEVTGHAGVIAEFGARFVTDTCTYVTPIMERPDGAVMTNSGKWAYYAPGNLGVEVVLASLEDCIESAVVGRLMIRGLS